MITVSTYINNIDKGKEEVCNVNCLQLEKMYELYLNTEGLDNSDIVFQQFLNDYKFKICPSGGEISYDDGKVKCSIHDNVESEEIPFL